MLNISISKEGWFSTGNKPFGSKVKMIWYMHWEASSSFPGCLFPYIYISPHIDFISDSSCKHRQANTYYEKGSFERIFCVLEVSSDQWNWFGGNWIAESCITMLRNKTGRGTNLLNTGVPDTELGSQHLFLPLLLTAHLEIISHISQVKRPTCLMSQQLSKHTANIWQCQEWWRGSQKEKFPF